MKFGDLHRLHGMHKRIITPFTAKDEIDEETLRILIRRNIAKKLDGLYMCGTIGEGLLMSPEERKEVFRIAANESDGKQTLIGHVGAMSTRDAIEMAQGAEECGYHAISAIPPFYFFYNLEEVKSYYSDIIASVNLPMLIYNAPDYEGVHLTIEQMCELADIPGVVGIKNSAPDTYMAAQIRKARPDMIFLHSYEHIYLAILPFRVHGVIGSHLNLIPEIYQRMVAHFEAGRLDEAWNEETKILEVHHTLMGIGEIQAIKAILGMIGIDCGVARKPHRRLDGPTLKRLEPMIEKYQIS